VTTTTTTTTDDTCSVHDDYHDDYVMHAEIDDSVLQADVINTGGLRNAYQLAMDKEHSADDIDFGPVLQLSVALDQLKVKLSAASRTSALWLQYLKQIKTLKLFLRAERTCQPLLIC